MSANTLTLRAVRSHGSWLYRLGGLAALLYGLANIAIIAMYVPLGPPPSGAEERLAYLAGETARWWTILGLSVLTDFLFVPIALALYQALSARHRTAMLAATACVGLFVMLDLAVTWTNYAALIPLSESYAAAANQAQRQLIVAAATYPAIVLESTLLFVYNTLSLSVAILILGLVMLAGHFSQSVAYLGIATGAAGIVAELGPILAPALSVAIIVASILTTVWVLTVGYRLFRLNHG